MAVPFKLAPYIGRKELTYSLKTKCYHTAKTRCMCVLSAVHSLFENWDEMKTLTRDEIKLFVGRYIKDQIDSLDNLTFRPDEYQKAIHDSRDRRERIETLENSKGSQHQIDRLYAEEDRAQEIMNNLQSLTVNSPAMVMVEICKRNRINPVKLSDAHRPLLVQAVSRIYEEIENLRNQYAEGALDISFNDTYLKEAMEYAYKAPLVTHDSSVTGDGTNIEADESILISEAYNSYLQQFNSNEVRAINKKRSSLDLWLEIIGDTPLGTIDKAKVRKFLSILQKLPSNRKKHYPDKSIKEILDLEISVDGFMTNSTINDHLSPLSSFMQFAVQQYNLPYNENPFAGMNLKKTGNKDEQRDPFNKKQLTGLFSSPIYQGCESPRTQARYREGKIIIKDSIYWVPLISAYSGIRLNEILQLYVGDIYQAEGIWVFDINQDGNDKKIKSTGSRRILPIHSKILELGFIEYLDKTKAKGESRAFYDAKMSSDGTYSNSFSKKFSNLLDRYDLKTPKTSFHSFRHNVTDILRFSEKVDDETSNFITGHTSQGVKARYGGSSTSKEYLLKRIPKMALAVEELQYPFLDDVL